MPRFNLRSEHVKSFIQVLVHNCQSIASAMRDSGRIDDTKYLEVFLEHLYLYLNITERMAFAAMQQKQIEALVTQIAENSIDLAIETACRHWPKDIKKNIYREAMQNFCEAMQEFGQYRRVYSSVQEGVKGTLIWEFSKKMAKITGAESNLGTIVGHESVVVAALKNIDIKSFIEKLTQ